MKRYYFVADNLDELKAVEAELEQQGVAPEQMHLLSQEDADVERHELHNTDSLMRKDVVRSLVRGFVVGLMMVVLSLAVLISIGYLFDIPILYSPLLLIIVSVIVLGFCTWEGGLFGIQEPNRQFRKYDEYLQSGKHLFFVDAEDNQHSTLAAVVEGHHLHALGTEAAEPGWILGFRRSWHRLIRSGP